MAENSKNFTLLARSDQGGRPDGAQVMVHRGYAYVGHMFSRGFSVLDVKDPRDPRPVNYIEAAPDTWTLHLQAHDDLLLVVNEANLFFPEILKDRRYEAGLRIYDISNGAEPKPIGFMPVEGPGVHRLWYDHGGKFAYLSCLLDGYSGHILVVADISDPTNPHEVGRFHLPGMWTAGGETADFGGRNISLHHALVHDGIAYAAWRDAGLVLIDVRDPFSPQHISTLCWSPPYAGNTHNPLPIAGRDLVIALDEANGAVWPDPGKHIWMVDARSSENPVTLARFPLPAEDDFEQRGGRSGPHNLWENRSNGFFDPNLVFATHCNAGLRVYDISDETRPREVAYFVPDSPTKLVDPRPNRPLITQSCDVFVDAEGIAYVTDYNAGLTIAQFNGI